ncbi:AIPR family protein [Thalassobaculum salexigens]|uniref:AIPR family protein n=1 Tax=Thalassobaculum salexigens TaxID=455360 RepID=UPI00048AE9F1|nr:AIPR family protein [Thalassobaculum salexigens]
MAKITTHTFRVAEARRMQHPTFPTIQKHVLLVRADQLPSGISWKANAREPVGLNRKVYKEVRSSLQGEEFTPGAFDLLNKGITILAEDVRLIDKAKGVYEVDIDNDRGIVDGAHTYQLILQEQDEGSIPPEQHVEVYIRTGIEPFMVSEIAQGLNTGMQVKPKSIYDISGVFDWIKSEIERSPYADIIGFKESDNKEFGVEDIIAVLEALNVLDFPNDQPIHPTSSYEKVSAPLQKFGNDYQEHQPNWHKSKYYKLRPILRDALVLFDKIRRDFPDEWNRQGGSAGKLKIVERAKNRKSWFKYPFSGDSPTEQRLSRPALMPILAAFRACVDIDPSTGQARWAGGFPSVLQLWEDAKAELVAETRATIKEHGNAPNIVGKTRSHWAGLHKTLRLRMALMHMKPTS